MRKLNYNFLLHLGIIETAKAVCTGSPPCTDEIGEKGKGIMKKENKNVLTLEEAQKRMERNGGWLDLSGTQIQALPENLTVGGWLDLRGTQIQALPENLTVGGSLYLSGTQIQALPENLTVGGSLYLRGTQIQARKYIRLNNGDYVPKRYLYADNILTHVKSRREIKGYVFYKGKIKNKNVIFDGKNYAHCATFREGVAELLFKSAADRGADQYKGLTLDSVLTLEEMKTMYRVITGACKQGTESFVESLGDKVKEQYSVKEAIELTAGQYNAEAFKQFFEE